MPMLPKRCCSDPMCGAVAAPGSSRCPAHARALQRSYDDRRGTTVERGYDSDHERLRVLCLSLIHIYSAGDQSCLDQSFLHASGAHNPRILQLGLKFLF